MKPPEPNFTQFYREEGLYDWTNPSKLNAKYIFIFSEKTSLETEFTIDLEYDNNYDQSQITPYNLALWLSDVYLTKYITHDHSKVLTEVIQYLSKRRQKDNEELMKYEVAYAQYQIFFWKNQLIGLKKKYYKNR